MMHSDQKRKERIRKLIEDHADFAKFEKIPPGLLVWFEEMYRRERMYKRIIMVMTGIIALLLWLLLSMR